MRRVLAGVIRQPWRALAVLLAISAGFAAGLIDWSTGRLSLGVDASVQPLLPKDDPARLIYDFSRAQFGHEDIVIVALRSEDALAPDKLKLLAQVHRGVAAMTGVRQVSSLHSASLARDVDGVTEVWTVPQWIQQFAVPRAQILAEIRQHSVFRRSLMSDDGQVAGLLIRLAQPTDEGLRDHLAARVRDEADRIVEQTAGDQVRVWAGGPGIASTATVEAITRSYQRLLPGIAIVFFLLLAYAFRSKRGVFLPLIIIAASVLWTLGLMAWLGRDLNLVTVIVPPLIMTLALAYSLHFFSTYYSLARRFARRPRLLIGLTLRRMVFPLILTGLTTICGFLGLLASPLPAVREFGAIAAVAVLLTVVLAVFLPPAALSLMPGPKVVRQPAAMVWLFGLLSRALLSYRGLMLGLGAVVAVLAVAAATQIRVGSNFVNDFSPDSRVRQDHEAIGRALGGANVFNILIRADLNDAFAQPDIVAALSELQAWLEQQPEIGVSVSLVDALREIDRALGGSVAAFQIPDQASTIKQMLLVGGGPELDAVVDSRLRSSNIVVRAAASDSFALGELVGRIEARLQQLPRPLQGHVTGESVMVAHTLSRIGEGQLLTVGASLLAIYLVLVVVFMSLRGALMALLPNLLPLLIYYGALGFFGVPLSPTTSLISCIVLGIAVDDTIHYLTRFNTLARRYGNETAATAEALQDVLRPVTLTSIALVLGFLMMTTSELQNQVHFGALAAFTMAMAWLSDVSFTPALASYMRVVTLWDLLRLDLGSKPREAIPLFRDLNLYQARTFALLARQRIYHVGHTLWRQGDSGEDMFVIIHGKLAVWLERDGERHLLTTLGRGDVLGEGGFFRQQRSATITVTEPAKLLQFSAADLDRITRRRPLLGARILRNLNYIQAERVARLSRQAVAASAD